MTVESGLLLTPMWPATGQDPTTAPNLAAFRIADCGSGSCSPLWQAHVDDLSQPAGRLSAVADANGIGYVTTIDGSLHAFAVATGAPLWRGRSASEAWSPTVAGGVVYVATTLGAVEAYPAGGCGAAVCPRYGPRNGDPPSSPSPSEVVVANGFVHTPLVTYHLADSSHPSAAPPGPVSDTAATTRTATNADVWFDPPAPKLWSVNAYRIQSVDGSISTEFESQPDVTNRTTMPVSGLVPGRAYRFTVTALSPAGAGPTSAPTNEVVPTGAPSFAEHLRATAYDGAAVVQWDPPADQGGLPMLEYDAITSKGTVSAAGCDDRVIIDGLANGEAVTAPSWPGTPVGAR